MKNHKVFEMEPTVVWWNYCKTFMMNDHNLATQFTENENQKVTNNLKNRIEN